MWSTSNQKNGTWQNFQCKSFWLKSVLSDSSSSRRNQMQDIRAFKWNLFTRNDRQTYSKGRQQGVWSVSGWAFWCISVSESHKPEVKPVYYSSGPNRNVSGTMFKNIGWETQSKQLAAIGCPSFQSPHISALRLGGLSPLPSSSSSSS